ncbi:hypothetical protein [Thioalkalivibrio versutus]|uniref:hypothetical protein n=1 Tax=Thioalkalivibrio versutus TaxID=106634 RepID=UPI000A7BA2E2|nr:hypothetical protein [Thioalkalivibrio versutus]
MRNNLVKKMGKALKHLLHPIMRRLPARRTYPFSEPPCPNRSTQSFPSTKPKRSVLESKEIASLNEPALEYLSSLSEDEISRRIDAVSVGEINSARGLEKARNLLREEGIVIVPDYLDNAEQNIANDAMSTVLHALNLTSEERNYEDDDILVQGGKRIATSYTEMATYSKTVVNVRRGNDFGMVDVFNVDRLVGSRKSAFRAPFITSGLLDLIGGSSNALEARNLNLYINRSVMQTRGFHVDSFKKNIKGFVYLTDVSSLDDGPYCYVRGSHLDGAWRKANQKLSEIAPAKTDSPFIDTRLAVPVLAPRGSLILSDQAGVHRGMPQGRGSERLVLVMRYS